jgi:hypothetical protein
MPVVGAMADEAKDSCWRSLPTFVVEFDLHEDLAFDDAFLIMRRTSNSSLGQGPHKEPVVALLATRTALATKLACMTRRAPKVIRDEKARTRVCAQAARRQIGMIASSSMARLRWRASEDRAGAGQA